MTECFSPSMSRLMTPSQFEEKTGLGFNGPGWYELPPDANWRWMLALPLRRVEGTEAVQKFNPAEPFRMYFYAHSPFEMINLLGRMPHREFRKLEANGVRHHANGHVAQPAKA